MIEKDLTFRREELETLSTPELDMILRSELDSDTPQRETVLFVLSILEERDSSNPGNRPEGAEEAWERLLSRSQYSENSKPKCCRKLPKYLCAVASAAVVALILSVVVPQAAGAENIFQVIGRWSKDIFGFVDSSSPTEPEPNHYIFETDNADLQQVYDMVVEQGITDPVVPTWLPENYELSEMKTITETNKIYALFHFEKSYVQLTIEDDCTESTYKYPKDDNIEFIELKGQKYYIIPNDGTWKAVWVTDTGIECFIVTNDTEEVLKTIIESIHRRLEI